MIKLKRRVLGNMRFIGELYIIGLISSKIMHSVIQELLADVTDPEEEEVESVCRLITTIGPQLDTVDSAPFWARYVTRMKTLVACTKLPTRVQFMVQDVLELRENRWVKKVHPVRGVPQPSAYEGGRSSFHGGGGRGGRDRDRERFGGPSHGPGPASGGYAAAPQPRPSLATTGSGPSRQQASSMQFQDARIDRNAVSAAPVMQQPAQQGAGFRTTAAPQQRQGAAPPQPSRASPASAAGGSITSGWRTKASSSPCPPQPATAASDEAGGTLADPKEAAKVAAVFDEAMKQKNVGDVYDILQEGGAAAPHLVASLIVHCMDKGRRHVDALTAATFLPGLVGEGRTIITSPAHVVSCLLVALANIDDLIVDIPNAFDFAGTIAAAFLALPKQQDGAALLTLSALHAAVLAPLLLAPGGADRSNKEASAAKILLHTLHRMQAAGTPITKEAIGAPIGALLAMPSDSVRALAEKLGLVHLLG